MALAGRGGGVVGLIFAGYVLLTSQNPYPMKNYSVTANKIEPILFAINLWGQHNN